ncbi:MAG: hypothetical protein KUG77_00810 [Nannocystaceae bacterium]|nr:hypothetical protein [Nannocystaceae bacterium]
MTGKALLSCGGAEPVELSMQGDIAYSFCSDDDADFCPFYLGALGVETSTPATVELLCEDGSSQSVVLDQFSVSLSQPGFGVSERGGDVSFGPGAWVAGIELELDGEEIRVRRPNATTARWSVDGGELNRSYLELSARVPCNDSVASLDMALALELDGVTASPPLAEVTMPTTVTCENVLALSGSFSDPDGDLDEVRWFVDGVRLADSVSSITISEAHEIRAVAVDDRGAATSDSVQVGCN